MLIDGLWNMITLPDGTKDPIKYIFHITIKDKCREVIHKDPEATGKYLHLLDGIEIDKRLITHEENDRYVINEVFMTSLIDNYNNEWMKFSPGILEKRYKDFTINLLYALYRNDSEYMCKFGGIS